MATQLQNALVILRLNQLRQKTGLSRSSIYALMKSGQFPKSIKLSARAVGWLESDIDDFISSKIAASFNHIEGV